jgi:hypothetical protein
MRVLRTVLRQAPYWIFGTGLGIGSALLWIRVLTPGLPRWVSGLLAAGCVLLLIGALAAVTRRRDRRRSPRRRIHARPKTFKPRRAA